MPALICCRLDKTIKQKRPKLNVQAQFEENQEEAIKVDSFKKFIEAIIKIFKKG